MQIQMYVQSQRMVRVHVKMRALAYTSLACVRLSQGRLLPSPELIPFRLTRDFVAAMGVAGVSGAFKQCGEATMEVLRHDVMPAWGRSVVKTGRGGCGNYISVHERERVRLCPCLWELGGRRW
jgi:hypothetical protein